jgi:universal stress protein A
MMFQKLSESSEKILGFKVTGKLTDEDYKAFVPQIEKIIREFGRISLLLELDDFHGWDLEAAWDDFKFGMKHIKDFKRVAIVGDKKWEEWMAKLAKAFMRAEVKYFDGSQLQDAWKWLDGKESKDTA